MTVYLLHWAFELGGSGCWACVRGKCNHRHHRIMGDAVLTGILTYIMVHTLG